jgi:hypothetical protein
LENHNFDDQQIIGPICPITLIPPTIFATPNLEAPAMPQPTGPEKVPLMLHLSPEVARRLMLAAETQRRPAADLAADLLDRYLPRVPPAGAKKGSIPYS